MSERLSIEVFKPTKDDWRSSYFGLVRIHLVELLTGDFAYQPKFRIFVAGGGYSGVEMLHDFDTESDARDCFMNIIQLKFVNFENLKKWNFLEVKK